MLTGEEFLAVCRKHYTTAGQDIPIAHGKVQYRFKCWMDNGNFQFSPYENMHLPAALLVAAKERYNEVGRVDNLERWCREQQGFKKVIGAITVLKNLLKQFP